MRPIYASRSEQEIFFDLEALCGSPGYIHVLAYISFRDNLIVYDGSLASQDVTDSYVPERTIRTEFSTLLGLLLKYTIDFNLPSSEDMQALVDRTQALLGELHASLNRPMLEGLKRVMSDQREGLPVEQIDSPFQRGDVLREPIFYGGESAYNFQYRDFAVERYAADDDWLYANKNFRIADARAVAHGLARLQGRKVSETIENMRQLDPSQWSVLSGFSSTADEVALEAGITVETARAVLVALTAPESPTNEHFVSLGDFNIANAFPILRSPTGEYVSLDTYGVVESLYDSPFYWMAADKSYRDTAFAHRGAFTESFVAKRFVSVFGADNVFRNVNILSNGQRVGEIDVLVLFADRAIVAQCKSKKLTLEARRGNDLQLRDDFKKSVQDAYDQAFLCSKSLSRADFEFVDGDGNKIELPSLREIYPVCVVSDHYPALTAQAREFLKYGTDEVVKPPLVGDVFLIDVLAEVLPSPLRLLSYINRRVSYVQRVASINELTILAYHLRHNLWIDDRADMVWLAEEFAIELDTVMMVRREGINGEATPRGILTRLDGTLVGRMLKAIEHRADAAQVDLGFMLLTLSGEALDDLNRGMGEIAQRARKDGQTHDFTLCFPKGDSGITVHCGSLPNAAAATKLAAHCELRKYAQHAENWYGLVVRPDDGLPKFGLNLRFPWKQDEAMDQSTKNMPRGGMLRRGDPAFKIRKIGRNESCPCGSGKKFKKCCMN